MKVFPTLSSEMKKAFSSLMRLQSERATRSTFMKQRARKVLEFFTPRDLKVNLELSFLLRARFTVSKISCMLHLKRKGMVVVVSMER